MSDVQHPNTAGAAAQRPWDARLARRFVRLLLHTWVSPNHLTTLRLIVGLAAAAAFTPGTYGWNNIGACLLVLSNFLDHTDGELARMSGKTSRFGHLYDLASDALVTILLFIGIGWGVGPDLSTEVPPAVCGAIAGSAIALIFFLRMRIEDRGGKAATRQASFGGFETEDVLYLLPLGTLFNALGPLLMAATVVAPLYAVWVVFEYRRTLRRPAALNNRPTSGVAR